MKTNRDVRTNIYNVCTGIPWRLSAIRSLEFFDSDSAFFQARFDLYSCAASRQITSLFDFNWKRKEEFGPDSSRKPLVVCCYGVSID